MLINTCSLSIRTAKRCQPYERMRRIVEALAGPLKVAPFRILIVGHTATKQSMPQRGDGKWQLSIDRANAVRQILEESGYLSNNIYSVAGTADTDPLIHEDPSVTPNRRVTTRICSPDATFVDYLPLCLELLKARVWSAGLRLWPDPNAKSRTIVTPGCEYDPSGLQSWFLGRDQGQRRHRRTGPKRRS